MISNHAPDGTWYQVCGNEKGPAVVLCHGVGLDLHMWDQQVSALGADYEVVRYDLIGHGKTPSNPADLNLDAFTRQLFALLKHLGLGRIALVGLSMGGVIAQRFAADHSELLTRLVLMNTVYKRQPEELEGVEARLRMTEEEGLLPVADAAIARWFDDAFVKDHAQVLDKIRTRLVTNDLAGYLAAYRVFVHAEPDVGAALKSVHCPTLIMTGGKDVGSTPLMARRMAEDLSDVQLPEGPGDDLDGHRVTDLIVMADNLEHREGISHVAFNFLVSEVCQALDEGLKAEHLEITQRWGQDFSRTYVTKMVRSLGNADLFTKGWHTATDSESGRSRRLRTFYLNRTHPLVEKVLEDRWAPQESQDEPVAAVSVAGPEPAGPSEYGDSSDTIGTSTNEGTADSTEPSFLSRIFRSNR